MGWSGDEFYLPRPILFSHIHTRYPTQIQSHPCPRRVRVSPRHPHLHSEYFFLIKKEVFFSKRNVVMHYRAKR